VNVGWLTSHTPFVNPAAVETLQITLEQLVHWFSFSIKIAAQEPSNGSRKLTWLDDLTEIPFGLSFFTLRTDVGMVLAGGSDGVFITAKT
jgi:hypothetical protein